MDSGTVVIVISALATALAAVLAPLVTAIVNNRHHSAEKQREVLYIHKSSIYDEFFSYCGEYQAYQGIANASKLIGAANKVLLICDSESRISVTALIKLVGEKYNVFPSAIDVILECNENLRNDLKSVRDKIY